MTYTNSYWAGKTVFITGATGLLGSHILRSLCEIGSEVVALTRELSRAKAERISEEYDLSRKVRWVTGEIQDADLFERVICEYQPHTIFHLAGQALIQTANSSPIPTLKSNVEGVWNLLETIRRHPNNIKCLVIASSARAYGKFNGSVHTEDAPLRGEHPYDVSKSCADLIARSYAVTYGLPVGIARCANFFGPGDNNFSRIIPGTIRDVSRGLRPVIRSNGKFVRDFLYVEDGVSAYLKLAEHLAKGDYLGEAFNFTSGQRLTVSEVVCQILEVMNRCDLQPVILDQATNEVPFQCLDSTKARMLLGWTPRFTFAKALRKTVDWYRQRNFEYATDSSLVNLASAAVHSFAGNPEPGNH